MPGQHRHAVDPRIDSRLAEPGERADSRLRRRRARLDPARELAIERDERDVNREIGDAD